MCPQFWILGSHNFQKALRKIFSTMCSKKLFCVIERRWNEQQLMENYVNVEHGNYKTHLCCLQLLLTMLLFYFHSFKFFEQSTNIGFFLFKLVNQSFKNQGSVVGCAPWKWI